jgi:hypothetical protein
VQNLSEWGYRNSEMFGRDVTDRVEGETRNHFLDRNIPFFFFPWLVMLPESEETRSIVGRSCDDMVVVSSAFPNEEAPAAFTRPLKDWNEFKVKISK